MADKPLKTVLVGAGHRGLCYAEYARNHPEQMQIVAVADPNERRRRQVSELYHLPPERNYRTAEELAAVKPRVGDAVINGTMDKQHVPTSIPLLEVGYHVLLEKPFATSEKEMWQLVEASRKHNCKVMICHVLRCTPFYQAIRQLLLENEIGEIINIQTVEHVSYHHMAVSHVRGKWSNREKCVSTMLLAKCCHDLDLIVWMLSGNPPSAISSFGSLLQFRSEKSPARAGTRCLVDCPIEPECLYSARKHYIDHPDRWAFYVWDSLEHIPKPTVEQKIESLKTNNPYGRCVWHCDNNVVDHQSVLIEFRNGCTATHNMVGGTSRPMRSIHIIGTTGEIQGVFEDSCFVVRHFDTRPDHEYSEKLVDLKVSGDMQGAFGGHGGGDEQLPKDFIHFVRGEKTSISCTSIEDSIYGHLLVFCADQAREEHRIVEIPRI